MIAKKFAKEDVDYIFDNLWSIGKEELIINGSSVEEGRKKFKSMIDKPWSTGFFKDGKCFALIIMEPSGHNKWRTNFAAIEKGFTDNWLTLTKFLKRASDKIVNDFTCGKGIIELSTSSDTDYNWFNAIGFELVGTDGFIDEYIKKAEV